jgi:hypothetical protein
MSVRIQSLAFKRTYLPPPRCFACSMAATTHFSTGSRRAHPMVPATNTSDGAPVMAWRCPMCSIISINRRYRGPLQIGGSHPSCRRIGPTSQIRRSQRACAADLASIHRIESACDAAGRNHRARTHSGLNRSTAYHPLVLDSTFHFSSCLFARCTDCIGRTCLERRRRHVRSQAIPKPPILLIGAREQRSNNQFCPYSNR